MKAVPPNQLARTLPIHGHWANLLQVNVYVTTDAIQ
jgi:hypothetical protein